VEDVTCHQQVAVGESGDVGAARSAAQQLATSAGFEETDAHRVGIVATEMATNLVKHARNGELLMRVVTAEPASEVEVLSLDRAGGMANVAESMADGHSTAGSAGTGLGAMRRMSELFDIHSAPGRGTAILTRFRQRRAAASNGLLPLTVAGVSVPKTGEPVCGDVWDVQYRHDGAFMLLVDGLGHGTFAADAATAARSIFRSRSFGSPADALAAIHEGIRHTRGAAGAIADLRVNGRSLSVSGVGNIATAVCGQGHIRQAVSHNGTLGHEARYFKEYSYPWEAGALLVMHSDGLSSHWSLDPYPGLRLRHPALIAAVLYRDFSRHRDDVTVLVGREARG
jgi:anti-sigma regulatory factor (Ser/Thr protein kinase)